MINQPINSRPPKILPCDMSLTCFLSYSTFLINDSSCVLIISLCDTNTSEFKKSGISLGLYIIKIQF